MMLLDLNMELWRKSNTDNKGNSLVQHIARDAGKNYWVLYLEPSEILYLYKIYIRTWMEYCCHILVGADQSSLSNFDNVSAALWAIHYFEPYSLFSNKRNTARFSLTDSYLYSKSEDEQHS